MVRVKYVRCVILSAVITIIYVSRNKLYQLPINADQLTKSRLLGMSQLMSTIFLDKKYDANNNLEGNFERDLTYKETVTFLKSMNNNCTVILTKENLAYQDSIKLPKLLSEMNLVLTEVKKNATVEGNSASCPHQQAIYVFLSRLSWVRLVCEIGFNAGHSALFWLAASNTTKILSFDIARWRYTKSMAEYLQMKFPQRISFVWGDSTKTVPQFIKNATSGFEKLTQGSKCDVIIIDGGHDYFTALADLRNMYAYANPLQHLVIIDDYNEARVQLAMKFAQKTLLKKYSICPFNTTLSKKIVFAHYLI